MYSKILSIFLSALMMLGLSSTCVGQGIQVDSFTLDFGPKVFVEGRDACGFELHASANNSLGNIKKVGAFDYFNPQSGIQNQEVRISNFSSSSGSIKLTTMRDNSQINTLQFGGGNNPNAIALRIIHSGLLPLDLKANGSMTIGGTLTENSDMRLKKNMEKLNRVLPNLSSISAYRYNWKNEKRGSELQIGVMAQDVQKVYPELVSTSEEGILSVSYSKLSVILLEATKELHQLYKEQESKIQELERKLSEK